MSPRISSAAAVASLYVPLIFRGEFCQAVTSVPGSPWNTETVDGFNVIDSTPSRSLFLNPREGTRGNPLFTAVMKGSCVFTVFAVLVFLMKVHGVYPSERSRNEGIRYAEGNLIVGTDARTGLVDEGDLFEDQIPESKQTSSRHQFKIAKSALGGIVKEAVADLGVKLASGLQAERVDEIGSIRQQGGDDLTELKSSLIVGIREALDNLKLEIVPGSAESSGSDARRSDVLELEASVEREAMRVMVELARLKKNAVKELPYAQEALVNNYEQVVSAATELKMSAQSVLDNLHVDAVFGSVQEQEHQQKMVMDALEAASRAELALQNLKNILLQERSKGSVLTGSFQEFTSAVLLVKVAAGKFRLHNPFLSKSTTRVANALLECITIIQRVVKTRDEEILEGASVLLMEVLRVLNSLESVGDASKDHSALREIHDSNMPSLTALIAEVTSLLQLVKEAEASISVENFNGASASIISVHRRLLDLAQEVEELNNGAASAKVCAARILIEQLYHASEGLGGLSEELPTGLGIW